MANANGIDFESPAPINEEQDEETLAAIDEGIRDAEAGRTVPIEDVRRLLREWITASSFERLSRTTEPGSAGNGRVSDRFEGRAGPVRASRKER